ELYHSVRVVEGSRLEGIMGGGTLRVNSFHHQAVKQLGGHLKVGALSRDGIIESIEADDDRFLLGIQWHPECLTRRYPEFVKLFRSLVEAAANQRDRRP
ncbi:MAG TPA: gamma-glutamyl-gamma-aminobutyrate hydrolase family protein, partial [Holophaga sp.]|nr:gamma-glutamyl-gamma-aminobutyrate hydrolase family protein [Holophaga sp.]